MYVRVRELACEVEESLGCPVDDSLRRDLARREARRFVREVEQLDDGQVEALLLRLIREVFGSHSRPAGILFGFLGGKSRVRVLMETLCVGEFERRGQT